MSWLSDEMERQRRAAGAPYEDEDGADAPVKPPAAIPPTRTASAGAPRGFGFPPELGSGKAHPAAGDRAALLNRIPQSSAAPANNAADTFAAQIAPTTVSWPESRPAAESRTPASYDLQALSDQLELRALREAKNLNIDEQGVTA